MEDDIDLFVIDNDKEKTYILEVSKNIKYGELKNKLIEKNIAKNNKFYVIFRNRKYTKEEKETVFNFSQGDRIYIESEVTLENYTECKFHKNAKLDEADMEVNKLSGILLLCLMNYIANNINDLSKIKNNEIREIIKELKEGVKMTGNPQKDIRESLKQKNGNNILTYMNYINEVISEQDIWNLINLFDRSLKN